MKVAILNGSPKPKSSASKLISEALQERIDLSADCVMCNAAKQERRKILEAIQGSDTLVFIFPLYVDGLPSHLLRLLDEELSAIEKAAPAATVYAVVNNGFYEGRQNAIAIKTMRNFTIRANMKWGQGIGVGAGGMIHSAHIGHGPMKKLGAELDKLAKNILDLTAADDYAFEPNFPRFLYKAAGHISWHRAARKNGISL